MYRARTIASLCSAFVSSGPATISCSMKRFQGLRTPPPQDAAVDQVADIAIAKECPVTDLHHGQLAGGNKPEHGCTGDAEPVRDGTNIQQLLALSGALALGHWPFVADRVIVE